MVARDERGPKAAELAAWSKSPRLREAAAFSYPEAGSLERADPSRKEKHSDRRRAQPETGTSREGHPHQCEDGPRLPCVFTHGQEPNRPGEWNRADTDL